MINLESPLAPDVHESVAGLIGSRVIAFRIRRSHISGHRFRSFLKFEHFGVRIQFSKPIE